ncbi:KTSC domain-containing protein [Amycolatopsis australiensis]|uniref:KTSC domain-containing protein n=1 Tax=Amycolatopsis australiensis TaxID=546364 RepID=A0A1K1QYN3_9PSEU|nr:KTSC domain-containing protein [Amycolatopsis australiensis]SFW64723.1 KTSC domain-containing protein [Amycolatopsis australiensis]
MRRQAVSSSTIASVGYDHAEHVLEIEFRNGRVYRYRLVPESVHRELLASPSHGRFFNTRIRDRYPAEQVG